MIEVIVKASSLRAEVKMPLPLMQQGWQMGKGPTPADVDALEESVAQAVGLAVAALQHQIDGIRTVALGEHA